MVRRTLLSLLAMIAGCEESSTQGELGAHCYPNGTCNVGLSCAGGVCFPADASVADAPVVVDAPPDAATSCATLEPNETIQTATPTPVAGTASTATYSNVAICPQGDKDTYQVAIVAANTNLEAVATWTGNPVSLSILNAGGAALNNGTANGAMSVRSLVANLPVGTYYVQVFASVTTTIPYELTITVN